MLMVFYLVMLSVSPIFGVKFISSSSSSNGCSESDQPDGFVAAFSGLSSYYVDTDVTERNLVDAQQR